MLESGDHPVDRAGGNGEADADAAARGRIDRRVHADDLSLLVERGTAGIALVDRRVDLQEAVVGPIADIAALGRNDPCRHRAAESVGIADRDHPVADLGRPLRQGDVGIIARLLDLEEREIRLRIRSDHFGVENLAVVHGHGDGLRILHDVIVGHDVAVVRNEEAGALAHDDRTRIGGSAVLLAEPPEELLDLRRQVAKRAASAVPSCTILTLTETTAGLTRAISGANDGRMSAWGPCAAGVDTSAAWAKWGSVRAPSPIAPAVASATTAAEARMRFRPREKEEEGKRDMV